MQRVTLVVDAPSVDSGALICCPRIRGRTKMVTTGRGCGHQILISGVRGYETRVHRIVLVQVFGLETTSHGFIVPSM